ncbi:MAG: ABC-2 transporter permease [Bacillota bacterium]|nr:ABC-2 transporter permease [Bacillota bacterium]
MIHILKQDMKRQIKIVLPILLLMLIGIVTGERIASVLLGPFVAAAFIVMIVLGGITITEYREDHWGGYDLYEVLPLNKRGVVTIKMFEIFLLSLLGSLAAVVFLKVVYAEILIVKASMMIVAASFGIALVMGAVYYLGTYSIGFDRFNKIGIAILLFAQGLAVYTQLRRYDDMRQLKTSEIVSFFDRLDPIAVLGIPLVTYLLLWQITVLIRRKRT